MTGEAQPARGREQGAQSAGGANSLVEELAEKIGARVGAATIFGQPVERGGVTVIPVAKARWGMAGGAGSGTTGGRTGGSAGGSADSTGGGGGLVGGMQVTPVGFIEVRDGGARYRPIVEPPLLPVAITIAACLGLAVARRVGRRRRG